MYPSIWQVLGQSVWSLSRDDNMNDGACDSRNLWASSGAISPKPTIQSNNRFQSTVEMRKRTIYWNGTEFGYTIASGWIGFKKNHVQQDVTQYFVWKTNFVKLISLEMTMDIQYPNPDQSQP